MLVRRARTKARSDDPTRNAVRPRVVCAFVNNMPDTAFDATERQFLDLLDAGSPDEDVEVRRYVLTNVPREEQTAARIAEEYAPSTEVFGDPPDLMIVTGSNPIEVDVHDEPYWDQLAELLSWGSENVSTMLLSCLSAHAAMSLFDGLERVRLPSKCTGVFPQRVEPGDPLSAGIETEILLPHSRYNTVPKEALEAAGYRIVIHSEAVGWSVATRDVSDCHVVSVQGHPEYDPSSLIREYRRDAGRYVRHERDELPSLPLQCTAPEDWAALEQLHESIIGGRRDPALIDSFPFDEVGARAPWPWRTMAQRLYANWLAGATTREG